MRTSPQALVTEQTEQRDLGMISPDDVGALSSPKLENQEEGFGGRKGRFLPLVFPRGHPWPSLELAEALE